MHLRAPEMVFDLPAGGRRLIQRADGYVATARRRPGDLRARRAHRRAPRPPRPLRFARLSAATGWRSASAPSGARRASRSWSSPDAADRLWGGEPDDSPKAGLLLHSMGYRDALVGGMLLRAGWRGEPTAGLVPRQRRRRRRGPARRDSSSTTAMSERANPRRPRRRGGRHRRRRPRRRLVRAAAAISSSGRSRQGGPLSGSGSRGRPRTRSPRMLRWMFSVPPPMRLDHWIRNMSCQKPAVGGVVVPERAGRRRGST